MDSYADHHVCQVLFHAWLWLCGYVLGCISVRNEQKENKKVHIKISVEKSSIRSLVPEQEWCSSSAFESWRGQELDIGTRNLAHLWERCPNPEKSNETCCLLWASHQTLLAVVTAQRIHLKSWGCGLVVRGVLGPEREYSAPGWACYVFKILIKIDTNNCICRRPHEYISFIKLVWWNNALDSFFVSCLITKLLLHDIRTLLQCLFNKVRVSLK